VRQRHYTLTPAHVRAHAQTRLQKHLEQGEAMASLDSRHPPETADEPEV
jgi:hypothetical protein